MYDGIKQKPHEHLFQKSGQPVTKANRGKNATNIKTHDIKWHILPNLFPVRYIVPIPLFHLTICTMVSNRSPMTIYFKSRDSQLLKQIAAKMQQILKPMILNDIFFPNMFPVKYIVPVPLLYIGLGTNASNRSPMTIYFKSRDSQLLKQIAAKMQKISKPLVLNEIFCQICFQSGILCQFLCFTLQYVRWYQTEAPWSFISKVGTASY